MIAAKAQIERPASLSDLVESTRCISTWSFGKVSTLVAQPATVSVANALPLPRSAIGGAPGTEESWLS